MSAVQQIFLTSALTVFGGLALLVTGEVVKRAFIDPINEQAQILVDIAEALVFYSNQITKPIYYPRGSYNPQKPPPISHEEQHANDASTAIRKLAARLRARNRTISWYGLWRLLRIAPKRQDMVLLSLLLIQLAQTTPPRTDFDSSENRFLLGRIDILLGTLPHVNAEPNMQPEGKPKSVPDWEPPQPY